VIPVVDFITVLGGPADAVSTGMRFGQSVLDFPTAPGLNPCYFKDGFIRRDNAVTSLKRPILPHSMAADHYAV
jgi:hypothetical protein